MVIIFRLAACAHERPGGANHDLDCDYSRLCEVIRCWLVMEYGLEDPMDLMKVDLAVQALGQSKLLVHRSMYSYVDFGILSSEEAKLRNKGIQYHQLFLRTMKELQASAAVRSRQQAKKELPERPAKPVVTGMGPVAVVGPGERSG